MQALQDLVGLEEYQLMQEHCRVILKPLKPWPTPDDTLLQGAALVKDGSLFWLDTDILVQCRAFFTSIQYQAAVFANCPSLKPPGAFAEAVADVAGKAPTVVVVHNSDSMDVLLEVFHEAGVLYLPHDLCLHEESAAFPDGPRHPLRELHGDCAALGSEHLVMTQRRVLQMGLRCPEMTVLNASLPDIKRAEADRFVCSGLVHEWKTLVLGHHYRGSRGVSESYSELSFHCMRMVDLVCPLVEHLTVCTSSPDVVIMAMCFDVKSLSVTFVPGLCSFDACTPCLAMSRRLEALSLRHFDGVNVAYLAAVLPGLRRLSLEHCTVRDTEAPIKPFGELQELEVGAMPLPSLRFLLDGCPNLSSLTLNNQDACVMFLQPSFPKSQLRKLKVLKLHLHSPLKQCGLHADDLRRLTEDLPALRHVATDSLDVRLYVENRMERATLHWYDCKVCAAEFPRQSRRHGNLWNKLHSRPTC
ncbi:unnamed protein product [Ixodes pacificus]